jgi:hypothetical protein
MRLNIIKSMNKNELKVNNNSKLVCTGKFLHIAPLWQAVPNRTLWIQ